MAVYCIKFWSEILSYHGAIGILMKPPIGIYDEKMKKVHFPTFTADIFTVQIAVQ